MSAVGLHKNFKSKNKKVREETEEVIKYLAENLDGQSFTSLNKLVHDLRVDVLNDQNHKLTADSFLIFLDKIRGLTPVNQRNQQIMERLGGCDISLMTPSRLMENYQKNSVDFKFEKTIRMDEIRQFAANVVPKPRFIFDNYKVDDVKYADDEDLSELSDSEKVERDEIAKKEQQKHDNDYFSFFNSHENIILKPESNFKGLRSFLTHLPIDYYILLQEGYDDKSKTENADGFPAATTNYLYVENIPLLSEQKTYFKKTSPIRTILLEDIYKCSNRFEAERLLEDPYAVEEMIRHLSSRYGEIEEQFFVNYPIDAIMNRMGMETKVNEGESLALKSNVGMDFEETLEKVRQGSRGQAVNEENVLEADNFDQLVMNMDKTDLKEEPKQYWDREEDPDAVERSFTKEELFD